MKQEKPLHTWRTRKDPLERIWPEALKMLREAPELEAKALFDHLSQSHPAEVKPGLLREKVCDTPKRCATPSNLFLHPITLGIWD